MDLTKYKKVDYSELQRELHKKKEEANIHDLNIASQIKAKAVGTVRNAFNEEKQITSDEILTRVFKALNLNAFIGWYEGERVYFISSK